VPNTSGSQQNTTKRESWSQIWKTLDYGRLMFFGKSASIKSAYLLRSVEFKRAAACCKAPAFLLN
jgi:hypothetical protein